MQTSSRSAPTGKPSACCIARQTPANAWHSLKSPRASQTSAATRRLARLVSLEVSTKPYRALAERGILDVRSLPQVQVSDKPELLPPRRSHPASALSAAFAFSLSALHACRSALRGKEANSAVYLEPVMAGQPTRRATPSSSQGAMAPLAFRRKLCVKALTGFRENGARWP